MHDLIRAVCYTLFHAGYVHIEYGENSCSTDLQEIFLEAFEKEQEVARVLYIRDNLAFYNRNHSIPIGAADAIKIYRLLRDAGREVDAT